MPSAKAIVLSTVVASFNTPSRPSSTLSPGLFVSKVMPRVSAFAKDAVVFTHAYAQAPNTPRSFPSFLTSRFPSEVKWVRMMAQFSPLVDDAALNTTVFEALHAHGLFTTGVFSHTRDSTLVAA